MVVAGSSRARITLVGVLLLYGPRRVVVQLAQSTERDRAVLRFHEFDGETNRQKSHDTADAGPNSQRRSDLGLQLRGDRDTRTRHVDDKASMCGAVSHGQSRMRTCGDDTRILS